MKELKLSQYKKLLFQKSNIDPNLKVKITKLNLLKRCGLKWILLPRHK